MGLIFFFVKHSPDRRSPGDRDLMLSSRRERSRRTQIAVIFARCYRASLFFFSRPLFPRNKLDPLSSRSVRRDRRFSGEKKRRDFTRQEP